MSPPFIAVWIFGYSTKCLGKKFIMLRVISYMVQTTIRMLIFSAINIEKKIYIVFNRSELDHAMQDIFESKSILYVV